MTEEQGRRIPIVDKRVSSRPQAAEEATPGVDAAPSQEVRGDEAIGSDGPLLIPEGSSEPVVGRVEPEQNDFLDDLKRLQADFDNYRKRMMREQAATAGRAKARLIERLLPVLDAFDQALTHDESSGGVELIAKQLRTTLEAEGLEEIPAEGAAFDPHVHEAVDSREDPDVDQAVARSVYRRGYRVGEQVLRPAMVVVARPPEPAEAEAAGTPDAPEGPEAAEA